MDGMGILGTVLAVVIAVLIFLLLREVFAWYYKINKIIANQEKLYNLLLKHFEPEKEVIEDEKEKKNQELTDN